jgi:integrase
MAIFKPKNSNNFHYRFNAKGKVWTGSTKTANKGNAVKFEAKRREEIYASLYLERGEREDYITLHQAIQRYFEDNEHRTLPKTYHVFHTKTLGTKIDIRNGKKLKVFGLDGDVNIDQLRERHVQNLITARFKEKNSHGTIIYELVFLSQVIKHVKRLGYMVPNIDFSDLKKQNKLHQKAGRLRYFTKAEEEAIIRELGADLPNDTAITKLQRLDAMHLAIALADLGARFGEVSQLKWESIDMDQKMIRLYRPKVKNESVLMMSDRLYQVFQARHAVKAEEQIYVFEGHKKGAHLASARVSFKKACERAGVKDATLHTFRHSYASKLVQANVSLYAVQQLLGHTNVSTTARYAHLVPTTAAFQAQEVLNAINAGS